MKISKRSLHYRFLSKMNGLPPRDLCRYMRDLVGFSFLCGVVVPIVIFGMIALPVSIIAGTVFIDALVDKFGVIIAIFLATSFVLGALAWLFVLVGTVIKIVDTIKQWQQYEPDSLFIVWWRARKEKICPLIEFTE